MVNMCCVIGNIMYEQAPEVVAAHNKSGHVLVAFDDSIERIERISGPWFASARPVILRDEYT